MFVSITSFVNVAVCESLKLSSASAVKCQNAHTITSYTIQMLLAFILLVAFVYTRHILESFGLLYCDWTLVVRWKSKRWPNNHSHLSWRWLDGEMACGQNFLVAIVISTIVFSTGEAVDSDIGWAKIIDIIRLTAMNLYFCWNVSIGLGKVAIVLPWIKRSSCIITVLCNA